MDVRAHRQTWWWIFAAAVFALGCGAHSEVMVVRLTEAAPGRGGAATSPEEPLAPMPPPRPRSEPDQDHDQAPGSPDSDPSAKARELFELGAEAYAQGDFPKAREAFQGAYDLVPERALLFNIASCELRMHDMVSACDHFRQYVAGGDPFEPRTQQVQAQVAARCGSIP